MNIPISVSAQAVNYNVPGLVLPSGQSGLHLSGCILANIYMGKITNWDDPSIAALNPGAKLPSLPIVPVHRVDGSGTPSSSPHSSPTPAAPGLAGRASEPW